MERLRYFGFAEESDYGESPSPAAIMIVDQVSSGLDTPTDAELLYEGGLTRGIRTHRPGFYAPTGNMVYGWDIGSIGWLLKWALGGYVFTSKGGEGALNLHELYGSEESIMKSFCARLGKDIFEHVFSGCAINSLELVAEGEFCMATVDIGAAKDAKDTLKTITQVKALLPPGYPLAYHELSVERIGAADISARIKQFTLSIGNNLDPVRGRRINFRHPKRAIAGARDINMSMQMFYDDTDFLELLWGGATEPAAGGSTEYGLQLVFDSGDHGSLTIRLPKLINTQVQQQPSGRDEIVQAIAGKSIVGAVELNDASKIETDIYCKLENVEDELEIVGS